MLLILVLSNKCRDGMLHRRNNAAISIFPVHCRRGFCFSVPKTRFSYSVPSKFKRNTLATRQREKKNTTSKYVRKSFLKTHMFQTNFPGWNRTPGICISCLCPTSVPSRLKSMAARLFCLLTRFFWWLTPYFSWSAR